MWLSVQRKRRPSLSKTKRNAWVLAFAARLVLAERKTSLEVGFFHHVNLKHTELVCVCVCLVLVLGRDESGKIVMPPSSPIVLTLTGRIPR